MLDKHEILSAGQIKIKVVDVSIGIAWQEKLRTLLKKKNLRWYAVVELQMIDQNPQNTNPYIAEQFFLVVCSPSYREKPNQRGPELDTRYTIVADSLDLGKILIEARSRVDEFKAKDWDEFYVEMEKRFLHENQ